MKARMISLVTLSLLIALFVGGVALAAEKYSGKIVSAAEDQVALTVDGQQHNFVANDETKVTLDGKPAKLTDLKAGFTAVIMANKAEDKLIATSITARSAQQ